MAKIELDNGKHVYLDGFLKNSLDSIAWNVNKDWDFVLIVTGDGMVRTGKSVLALNISAYLAHVLKTRFDVENNVFFESDKMMEAAQKAPKNSVFQYDEAREGLATSKRFSKMQQDLVDFFNECGQLNHIFVLVLPDYFSLQWELATNRSEMLFNVYRESENVMRQMRGSKDLVPVTVFKRGRFEIFNRKKKQQLYWTAKRSGLRQYSLVKPNCRGSFTNNYPVSEEEYRAKKKDMLARFTERHADNQEKIGVKEKIILMLGEACEGKDLTTISKRYNYAPRYLYNYVTKIRQKYGNAVTSADVKEEIDLISKQKSFKMPNLGGV